MSQPIAAPRRFTGRHMAAILIVFFGIVIAVNMLMARMAIATFGGTTVANSYVASQTYNHWLKAADRQAALGWAVTAARTADGTLLLTTRDAAGPSTEFVIAATARHPLGRAPERAVRFVPMAGGTWRSTAPLPPGRWQLDLLVQRGADQYRLQADLP